MKDSMDAKLAVGPFDGQTSDESQENLPSHLVATMWLCMLTSLDTDSLESLGDCNMAVAFDLGIAVQVSDEEDVPLAELMAEVFEFYNEKMELTLPSAKLGVAMATSYQKAQSVQHRVH
ncbi:hypothetical protein Fbal_1625 [Ferrimonas balearica DSM 9799]|uniref:Uncharacterized protein n=1 Tax=Ferrimonas balearica (strain DSM 9799 / CCM 4581 / KCTC 23876 / PAT) TaxID=550540 RepID=E1SQN1_FERBD|nr:hypothetical protein [Ferrimonas balearica]ADN75829.1 hypothetical protein Fbal_1625 [Ferrimonas balearica DSM 9799]